jgi:hypothetical protein
VIALGVYLLINRRHPRFLARVPPSRLALWSFLAAMAHGAGLMLVPIYLGICRTVETNAGHAAADTLMVGNARIAIRRAGAHTADDAVGRGLAVGVYHWLGLKFLSRSWFNLDLIWALSLIVVGRRGARAPVRHAGRRHGLRLRRAGGLRDAGAADRQRAARQVLALHGLVAAAAVGRAEDLCAGRCDPSAPDLRTPAGAVGEKRADPLDGGRAQHAHRCVELRGGSRARRGVA